MIEAVAMFFVGALPLVGFGFVSRMLAKRLVHEETAPYIGFSLALGVYVAGGFRGIDTSSEYERAGLALGMICGLIFLWYYFFKRGKAED